MYQHSLEVAYASYKFAKKHHLNVRDISVGALLHDFYYKPWQENTQKKKFTKMHGFVHAREALENAGLEFVEAEVQMVPSTTIELSDEGAEKMERLIDNLNDLDDVMNVYHNWAE